MKTKVIVTLVLFLFLVSACTFTGKTTAAVEKKKIDRDTAEKKALKYVYEHTKNKEIFDKEVVVENFIFDSWKEGQVWHVILFVHHTFVEVLVYDDGSGKIKVLTKTDYWKNLPKEVKSQIWAKAQEKALSK